MTVYVDTSALVKKYVREQGSDQVAELWKGGQEMATSRVAYAEAMAAFARRRREGTLSENAFSVTLARFDADWQRLTRIAVSERVNHTVRRLVAAHPLRGFDAIHLASAVLIAETGHTETQFVCADRRLLTAAEGEGLNVQSV